jgi:hypothetical protein
MSCYRSVEVRYGSLKLCYGSLEGSYGGLAWFGPATAGGFTGSFSPTALSGSTFFGMERLFIVGGGAFHRMAGHFRT